MPGWMQIHAQKPPKNPMLESYFCGEKFKPIKSIFSYMHTRHNVTTKEAAEKGNAQANNSDAYRIYQWNEDIKSQKYDAIPVAKKVGNPY